MANQGKKKRKGNKWIGRLIALAVAGGIAGWVVWSQGEQPGEEMPDMGRAHVPDGSLAPEYKNYPPTSGPHSTPYRWGESLAEIPETNQVHNLEHGGILIQYNCDKLPGGQDCVTFQNALREIFRKARNEVDHKVVLAPYGKLERPVALTAWNRRKFLDAADEDAILNFVEIHINSAPERVD